MNTKDSVLIAGCLSQDPVAQTDLYKELFPFVRSVVYRVLRNFPDEVDDVVQESFITIFSTLSSFRGDCALKSWVYRISLMKTLEYIRRNHFKMFSSLSVSDETVNLVSLIKDPCDVQRDFESKELSEKVLAKLPSSCRDMLTLVHLLGFKQRDLLKYYGETNLSTMKSRLFKARRTARELRAAGHFYAEGL